MARSLLRRLVDFDPGVPVFITLFFSSSPIANHCPLIVSRPSTSLVPTQPPVYELSEPPRYQLPLLGPTACSVLLSTAHRHIPDGDDLTLRPGFDSIVAACHLRTKVALLYARQTYTVPVPAGWTRSIRSDSIDQVGTTGANGRLHPLALWGS